MKTEFSCFMFSWISSVLGLIEDWNPHHVLSLTQSQVCIFSGQLCIHNRRKGKRRKRYLPPSWNLCWCFPSLRIGVPQCTIENPNRCSRDWKQGWESSGMRVLQVFEKRKLSWDLRVAKAPNLIMEKKEQAGPKVAGAFDMWEHGEQGKASEAWGHRASGARLHRAAATGGSLRCSLNICCTCGVQGRHSHVATIFIMMVWTNFQTFLHRNLDSFKQIRTSGDVSPTFTCSKSMVQQRLLHRKELCLTT